MGRPTCGTINGKLHTHTRTDTSSQLLFAVRFHWVCDTFGASMLNICFVFSFHFIRILVFINNFRWLRHWVNTNAKRNACFPRFWIHLDLVYRASRHLVCFSQKSLQRFVVRIMYLYDPPNKSVFNSVEGCAIDSRRFRCAFDRN